MSIDWNGKGLPPVGVVCECMVSAGTEWVECEVVAHKEYFKRKYAIAFVDENTVMLSGGIRFRPIRTPDQIAAEERRSAVLEMKGYLSFSDYREAEQHCEALYDAGYRKHSNS